MRTRLEAVGIAVAFAWLAFAPTQAEATILTAGCSNTNVSCSLAELAAGGSFTTNDQRYDDWRVLLSSSGIDLSKIDVIPLDDQPSNPGFRVVANDQLRGNTDQGLLDFDVTVTYVPGGASLSGVSVSLDDFDAVGSGGIDLQKEVFALDTVAGGRGTFLDAALVTADPAMGTFDLFDAVSFAPREAIVLGDNIALDSLDDTDVLRVFEQRVSQVPEPTSLGLLGLVLALAAGRRARRSRG